MLIAIPSIAMAFLSRPIVSDSEVLGLIVLPLLGLLAAIYFWRQSKKKKKGTTMDGRKK